jgi:hypothetical protein
VPLSLASAAACSSKNVQLHKLSYSKQDQYLPTLITSKIQVQLNLGLKTSI